MSGLQELFVQCVAAAADVMGWRILYANSGLADRSGARTAARDLALAMAARGHQPIMYAPVLGDIAEEMRGRGIDVVSNLDEIAAAPDLIHGHQHVAMVEAMLRFPRAPGVFVCHDRRHYMAAPPRIRRIRRYVAVDDNCLERLTIDYAIPESSTTVIRNSVDTSRFRQRGPLPPRPLRAVIFSNYAGVNTHLEPIQHACAQAGIAVDVIGTESGHPSATPEDVLGDYDLVFAKARCALEAMAVGAAVVLCDAQGLGPMVTSGALDELRRWNFGMRLLTEPLAPLLIGQQMARYDAADARVVSDRIRREADLSGSCHEYLRLYTEILSETPTPVKTLAEELDEYLRGTADRISELETELQRFRQPYRMERLSDNDCERMSVAIIYCPAAADSGQLLPVDIEVDNAGDEMVGSFPPLPVYLSYHWYHADSGQLLVWDGLRSALTPALEPAQKHAYRLWIPAPDTSGRLRLRVTLVQETIRWLDLLPKPVAAEALVEVVGRE
jgi:hypothetical protein